MFAVWWGGWYVVQFFVVRGWGGNMNMDMGCWKGREMDRVDVCADVDDRWLAVRFSSRNEWRD